jgi:acyl-CoA dehydrogenase
MPDRAFLNWPFFDDAHRQMAEELDDWVDREIAPLEPEEVDVDAACRHLVTKLGEGGWLRYCVPAAYGGIRDRLDIRSLCLARETLARTSGLADVAFAMQGLGSASISLYGSEDLKQRYLPRVSTGDQIAAFAVSEPEAGSDVGSIRTAAREVGGNYVLDGTKTWISNAGIADHYVVFARTGEPGPGGLSAFVVGADTPGLEVLERIQMSAPHPIGTLRFEGCHVPASSLLGKPGQGFKIALATLDLFRSTVGAAALGFARRALDEATARSRSRVAFGQRIAEFQLVQEKLADMEVDVDASALLVYRAAWVSDRVGDRVTREAAMAKMFATEAAQRVVDSAVQLFGGLGVVRGVPVERLYREVRALRIYEGATEIQKLIIARQVLAAAAAAEG